MSQTSTTAVIVALILTGAVVSALVITAAQPNNQAVTNDMSKPATDLEVTSPPAPPQAPPDTVACTQDAKECPDGSFVGRVAPSCEFAACPSASAETDESVFCTQDVKECPDGSFVSRVAPSCEFATCSSPGNPNQQLQAQ